MSSDLQVGGASMGPPNERKKKRKKKNSPPYKTYNVVTIEHGNAPTIIRPVNEFDVLLLDNYPNGGFDYSKVPGNVKLRKLVGLSQKNFDSMVHKVGSNDNQEGRDALSQSVAQIIRNEWKGFFLRRINPEDPDCTEWVDIGEDASVNEISAKFQANQDESLKPPARVKIKTEPGLHEPYQIIPAPPMHGMEQPLNEAEEAMMPPHAAMPSTTNYLNSVGTEANTDQNTLYPPQTPMILKMGPNGTPQLPPLPGSLAGISPGIAFAQNMPETPAMPPLNAPEHFSPQAPPLSNLPGVEPVTGIKPVPPPEPAASAPAPPRPDPKPAPKPAVGKRKRGRPRKGSTVPSLPPNAKFKRPRGRPRKVEVEAELAGGFLARKKIQLPVERVNHTLQPLTASTNSLRGDGPLMLSPAEKDGLPNRETNEHRGFQFEECAGIGVATMDSHSELPVPELPPLDATEASLRASDFSMQPVNNKLIPQTPLRKRPSTVMISPPRASSPFPMPSPPRENDRTDSAIEQAKAYLKVKDPEWMFHYDRLVYCRISLYTTGGMSKWVSGQVRYITQTKQRNVNHLLSDWMYDQQQMYKEYCAWEEEKYERRFRPLKKPEARKKITNTANTTKVVADDKKKRRKKALPSDNKAAASRHQPSRKPAPLNGQAPAEVNQQGDTKKDANVNSSRAKNENEVEPPTRPRRTKKVVSKRKDLPTNQTKEKPKKKQKQASRIAQQDDSETAYIKQADGGKENNSATATLGGKKEEAAAKKRPLQNSQANTVAERAMTNQGAPETVDFQPLPVDSFHRMRETLSQTQARKDAFKHPEGNAYSDKARMSNGREMLEESRRAREQEIEKLREVQRAKILLLDHIRFIWQPDREPPEDAPDEWKESFYDLRDYVRSRGDTAVSDGVELGVWAQLQRKRFQRSLEILHKQMSSAGSEENNELPLSRGQMAALRALGFDWDDLESSQFYIMYLKLLEFKSRVGDCLVPPPENERQFNEDDDDEDDGDFMINARADPNLFFWVQRQRHEYARMMKLKEEAEQRASGVDEEGLDLVNRLLIEERRDERLQRRGYSSKAAGHDDDDGTVVCDLVQSPETGAKAFSTGGIKPEPKKRGRPKKVRVQSSEYISTLTQAHIDALNGANFLWGNDITFQWMRQYRRVHAFYINNGHSKVTRGSQLCKNIKLYRWCSQVRQAYQRTVSGQKHGLSQDKIFLLNRIEFTFEFQDLPVRRAWQDRVEWLRDFKAEHGHCRVPQKHPTLGNFVKRVRKEYERHCSGEKAMDPEKLKALTELGFEWRLKGAVKGDGDSDDDDDDDDENDESSSSGEEEEGGVDGENEEEEEVEEESDDDEDELVKRQKRVVDSLRVPKSPTSSNECSGCFSAILFPSAECRACRRGYCQDCFDEILHCNNANCSACRGPVATTSAGWTHL